MFLIYIEIAHLKAQCRACLPGIETYAHLFFFVNIAKIILPQI